MWVYGWEPLLVSHHPGKVGSLMHCSIADVMFLICHVTSRQLRVQTVVWFYVWWFLMTKSPNCYVSSCDHFTHIAIEWKSKSVSKAMWFRYGNQIQTQIQIFDPGVQERSDGVDSKV